MSDLFDFTAYEPGGRTARFEIPIRGALILREPKPGESLEAGAEPEFVEGQPFVILKHAGESNKPYMNGVAQATLKASRGTRKAATAERIMQASNENVLQDRELFPEHVIVGWGNMPGPDRKPVPFTRAAAKVFCAKLPDWIFVRMRAYAQNPVNFVNEEEAGRVVEEEDVKRTAGN